MSDAVTLEVEGLRERLGELRRLDKGLDPALKAAGDRAAHVVAGEARRNAPVFDGKPRTKQRIIQNIKAVATTTGGAIRFGGPQAPHAPIIEFGGTIRRAGGATRTVTFKRGKNRGRTVTRGLTRRERLKQLNFAQRFLTPGAADAGRTRIAPQPYLYPAIASTRGEVLDIFRGELDTLTRHFPQA